MSLINSKREQWKVWKLHFRRRKRNPCTFACAVTLWLSRLRCQPHFWASVRPSSDSRGPAAFVRLCNRLKSVVANFSLCNKIARGLDPMTMKNSRVVKWENGFGFGRVRNLIRMRILGLRFGMELSVVCGSCGSSTFWFFGQTAEFHCLTSLILVKDCECHGAFLESSLRTYRPLSLFLSAKLWHNFTLRRNQSENRPLPVSEQKTNAFAHFFGRRSWFYNRNVQFEIFRKRKLFWFLARPVYAISKIDFLFAPTKKPYKHKQHLLPNVHRMNETCVCRHRNALQNLLVQFFESNRRPLNC